MGTRATVVIKEKRDSMPIVGIYSHTDGYIEGLGNLLVSFLQGKKIINGFGVNTEQYKDLFNGIGDLVFRLISFLKKYQLETTKKFKQEISQHMKIENTFNIENPSDLIGGYYLLGPYDINSQDIEYYYEIFVQGDEIHIIVRDSDGDIQEANVTKYESFI